MTTRQQKILKTIVSQYIKTAQPVASEYLAENFGCEISSATVRNEMAELVQKGYLLQPHASSGRIPRVKGFKYYVENLLVRRELPSIDKKILDKARKETETREISVKKVAKEISVLAGALSIVAFNRNQFYYTGLTCLFKQPEFDCANTVYSVSRVVDHLDGIILELLDSLSERTEVLIGEENPFSESCTAIIGRCRLAGHDSQSLFGLLGPVRMNYNKNIALVDYARQMFSEVE